MNNEFTHLERRQLRIFALTAFALPYLLGILMGIAYCTGGDVSVYPNAQMYYPAAGVMLAMLITRRGDPLLPRRFYGAFLALTGVMALMAAGSFFFPQVPWALVSQLPIVLGSVVCWIFWFLDKKEKRTAYGLRATGEGKRRPWLYVLLFVALYLGRIFLPVLLAGGQGLEELIFAPVIQLISFLSLPINFFLVFTAFFGEEYGWRGFLQPLLQKRFGPRKGILLLGVVWGIWHLPINLFFYSPDTWLQSLVAQQITCISYSIFFGFAYAKTRNIWVPTWIHFLNNNMIAVFASASAIQNQVIGWGEVAFSLVTAAVFYGLFFLAPVFRRREAPLLPLHGEEPQQS